MYIKAIKHIRRLRGGSQAQLMAARTTDTSTSLNSRAIRKPRVYWRTTTWRLARMVGLNAHIASWDDFEPWLSRIERCSKAILQSIARDISIEWYGEPNDLDCLLDSLFERRRAVRCPIDDFRKSHRNPFPNWKLGPTAGTSSDRIRSLASVIGVARNSASVPRASIRIEGF